jgi:hypothetical protein
MLFENSIILSFVCGYCSDKVKGTTNKKKKKILLVSIGVVHGKMFGPEHCGECDWALQ